MYCEDTENEDSYLYNLYAHRARISYKISDNKIFAINDHPEWTESELLAATYKI